MFNRNEHLDDYGLQVDPLFNIIDELLSAYNELLEAVIEYRDYKHDGDPFSEDARAMGEMMIDDMGRNGRLDKYIKLRDGINGLMPAKNRRKCKKEK